MAVEADNMLSDFYPYENLPMKYTEIFSAVKIERKFHWKTFDIFLIFAQNIDCEYPQSMFGAKIRKIGIPMHTPVLLYKSGVQGGILYTDMFS